MASLPHCPRLQRYGLGLRLPVLDGKLAALD